jgi:hypothetical protein
MDKEMRDGWPVDSGKALTTAAYRNTYANGFLPADGAEGTVIHPTGVFFGFEGSPNMNDPTDIEVNGEKTVNLDSYWNKIDLFQQLDAGLTQMTMTIRRTAFSPTSLDVKARVAVGNLVLLSFNAEDNKNQWTSCVFDNPAFTPDHFSKTGVLELPYSQPEGPKNHGGHAMVIVGYDDGGCAKFDGAGAFKAHNSWGEDWGDHGFWYLPYSMVDGVQCVLAGGNDRHRSKVEKESEGWILRNPSVPRKEGITGLWSVGLRRTKENQNGA